MISKWREQEGLLGEAQRHVVSDLKSGAPRVVGPEVDGRKELPAERHGSEAQRWETRDGAAMLR